MGIKRRSALMIVSVAAPSTPPSARGANSLFYTMVTHDPGLELLEIGAPPDRQAKT